MKDAVQWLQTKREVCLSTIDLHPFDVAKEGSMSRDTTAAVMFDDNPVYQRQRTEKQRA